ncbi:ABC transporter permease [Actinomadura sp. SCN-SB]|uniref:ABC transporter permease n=1 Tax=Actinomadura sp. SCN-SB TaxID=3373092 RepID=UPI0037501BE2
MTATVTAPRDATPPVVDDPPAPSLVRLTLIEFRKTVDTRSGRWLLIVIALCTPALMPLILFTMPAEEQTLRELFIASQAGPMILLPVLGILSVTSEWSQRTALTTFALVPHRRRVLAAKLPACALPAAVFVGIGLAGSVAARAIGGATGRSEGSWSLPPELVGQTLLTSVVLVVMGVAFGLVLGSPASAIVLYFVLPTLWTTLGEMVRRLTGPARWLDTNKTLESLASPDVTGVEWARVGTSVAVWVLLPLLIGTIRLVRREVK